MTNARLIVQAADKNPTEHEIAKIISIGSAADNQIRIRDQRVVPYHAIIVRVNDSYLISEIGGSGVFVNGAQIDANHPLRDGDVISIGEAAKIRFLMPAAQVPSADVAPSPSLQNSGESAAAGGASSGTVNSATRSQAVGGKSSETFSWTHIALASTVGLAIVGIAALIYFYVVVKGDGLIEQPKAVEITVDFSTDPDLDFIRAKAEALAGLLSGGNGSDFVFETEFVDRILNRTSEFRTDFYAAAEQYKFEINSTFRNDAGLSELFGYILAQSRSRFVAGAIVNGCGVNSDGVGIWRLPQSIVRQFGQSGADPNQEVSIAANHFKELLGYFDGAEGFMYAVACFGESGERAGKIAQLAPDENQRRNFWVSARAGGLTQDEISRVVCFMAAGIVAQNPTRFGINRPSLSDWAK